MSQYIKVTRYPYEEPDNLNLVIEASNGRFSSKIEIYTTTQWLIDLAKPLEVFPRYSNDVILSELGSEYSEDRWAYYLRIRAITTNALGRCAIQIRSNNNRPLPFRELSEFCIEAEPSQINRFGKLLGDFAKLEVNVLEWTVIQGQIMQIDNV